MTLRMVEALLLNNKMDTVYSIPRETLLEYEEVVADALKGPMFLRDKKDDDTNVLQLVKQGNKDVSVTVSLSADPKLRVTYSTSSQAKLAEPELVRLQLTSEGDDLVFKLHVDLDPLTNCKCQDEKCAAGGDCKKFEGLRDELRALLNELVEKAVVFMPSTEPTMAEEADDSDRKAQIYVFKARVGGGTQQSWVNHWALGVDFGDCWVTLEGLNCQLKLVASYLKSKTPPNGTRCTMEESNKECALPSLRLANILELKTSPQKLRSIALKNRLNNVKYELVNFNCQNWAVETVKIIQREASV